MADVCVYTANFGGYDTPRGHVDQDIECDWRYFHDGQRPPPSGWIDCPTMGFPARGQPDTPIMRAKWWKMHPPVGYEHAIWIDANMEITSPSFAREAIETLRLPGAAARDHGLRSLFAVWRHPRRDDLFDEIIASIVTEAREKYAPVKKAMVDQGVAYEQLGMPRHTGLYACGTIVWTPEAWPIARAWWDECMRWTPQDQVSLPFVCWALDTSPAVFPLGQIDSRMSVRGQPFLANGWLRIWPHGAS